MRFLSVLSKWICRSAAIAALPFVCRGADVPGNVVLQYHYLGAAQLVGNTNLAAAGRVFSLPSTERFETLVLNRMAVEFAHSIHFPTNAQAITLLRPLLNDLLQSESIAAMGGPFDQPINYIVAVHLSTQNARVWEQNLKTINEQGTALHAESYAGWQWQSDAKDSFWILPADNWVLVGRGHELASIRSDYLKEIKKNGRPAPELDVNWFEANVDWLQLTNWFPLPTCPFKLGRMQVAITAEKGGNHIVSRVTYPQPIEWHSKPWRVYTNIVREPLTSFSAGQDVEAFLVPSQTLSKLSADPLHDQFVFWSMRQMPLQSYMVWPAENPSVTVQQWSTPLLSALNPELQSLNGTTLISISQPPRISWDKMEYVTPTIEPCPKDSQNLMMAALFPITPGTRPAPAALWEQFQQRSDLVYYDWEFTGPRLRHLRALSQLLPILQALDIGPKNPFGKGKSMLDIANAKVLSRLNVEEHWLEGLTDVLGNTVTEVTKTGPAELTITRSAPFVFSSLELLLISHWLSDTPAGPPNPNLIPQAKLSPGGMPHPPPAPAHH